MTRQLDEIFHPPGWTPDANGDGNHDAKAIEPGPLLVCLADVEPRDVDWVWPGRIPAGRITLLVGRPGAGKSFLCSEVTARVTTGSSWPDGHGKAPLGDVLIISAEDDAHDTIRPRLWYDAKNRLGTSSAGDPTLAFIEKQLATLKPR